MTATSAPEEHRRLRACPESSEGMTEHILKALLMIALFFKVL